MEEDDGMVMGMMRNFRVFVLLLLLLVLSTNNVCFGDGGVANVTLLWSGGEPLTQCAAGIQMPSFACNYGDRGDFMDGAQDFEDPTPPNSVIINITATLYGTFGCLPPPAPNTTVYLKIGNTVFAVADLPLNLPCFSANCVSTYQVTSTICFPYNHQQVNNFQIIPQYNYLCLSQIVLEFAYQMATPFTGTITPALGPLSGGTSVTVSGYTPPPGEENNVICVFDSTQSQAFYLDQAVVCTSPQQNVSGVVPFYVTTRSPCAAQVGSQFVYYQPPVVTSVSPTTGKSTGGTMITLTGSSFFNSSFLGCKLGQTLLGTAIFINQTQMICVTPAGTGTGFNLSITFNGQQYTPCNAMFNYEVTHNFWNATTMSWVIVGVSGLAAVGLVVLFIALIKSRFKHDGYEQIVEGKQITIDEVRLGIRIGKGNFGEVYKAYWRGAEIAVKKLPAHNMTDQFLKDFHKEVSLMRALRHPNVLQFLGSCTVVPDICICTEYMPRGSLYKILHDPAQTLTWALIKKMCIDAAKGCVYLHDCTPIIVHRDLKSHNLLVDENWKVKVCDFGLSTIVEQASRTLTACGTPCWTAPEVLRNQRYTEKADVYSFGVVLWECATRDDPFVGMPPFQVIFAVGREGLRPPLPRVCPPEFAKLITDCWDEKPHTRPSMKEVLSRLENIDTTGWPDVPVRNPSPIV